MRYRGNQVVPGCVTLVPTGRGQWGPPHAPIKRRLVRGSNAFSVNACSKVLDVLRTINAWGCKAGSRCVKRMPNVKSAVKCLDEDKGTTSAGKSDVLLVMYTITPKRTGVS